MDINNVAKLLRTTGYNFYGAALMASHCPKGKQIWEDLQVMNPGDLVVEISTIWLHRTMGDINSIGRLVSVTMEPVDFGDPEFVWDEETEGRPHPLEKCYNITTLDGRPFRWTNARFVKIPEYLYR
jgi:hypothetical protein